MDRNNSIIPLLLLNKEINFNNLWAWIKKGERSEIRMGQMVPSGASRGGQTRNKKGEENGWADLRRKLKHKRNVIRKKDIKLERPEGSLGKLGRFTRRDPGRNPIAGADNWFFKKSDFMKDKNLMTKLGVREVNGGPDRYCARQSHTQEGELINIIGGFLGKGIWKKDLIRILPPVLFGQGGMDSRTTVEYAKRKTGTLTQDYGKGKGGLVTPYSDWNNDVSVPNIVIREAAFGAGKCPMDAVYLVHVLQAGKEIGQKEKVRRGTQSFREVKLTITGY